MCEQLSCQKFSFDSITPNTLLLNSALQKKVEIQNGERVRTSYMLLKHSTQRLQFKVCKIQNCSTSFVKTTAFLFIQLGCAVFAENWVKERCFACELNSTRWQKGQLVLLLLSVLLWAQPCYCRPKVHKKHFPSFNRLNFVRASKAYYCSFFSACGGIRTDKICQYQQPYLPVLA